jgi:ribonuclease P protein component
MPGFVLLVRERGDEDPRMRLGITVTRKVGGAVVRNRIKRRFRALAREVLSQRGRAGADHVLIGRSGAAERDYALLKSELETALAKLPPPSRRARPVEAPALPSKDRGNEKPASSSGRTSGDGSA